jgi:hypothetical protein
MPAESFTLLESLKHIEMIGHQHSVAWSNYVPDWQPPFFSSRCSRPGCLARAGGAFRDTQRDV